MEEVQKARWQPWWAAPRLRPAVNGAWLGFALASGALALGLGLISSISQIAAQESGFNAPATLDIGAIPGFRKRGTVFVGEVQGGNGTVLRLVFAAKTNALIGMQVLDAPVRREVDAPAACPITQAPPATRALAPGEPEPEHQTGSAP